MKSLSTGRLKRSSFHMLAIAAAVAAASAVRADTLFFNGNYDFNDAATSQSNVPINTGGTYVLDKTLVYDNFTVPIGQSWSLATLYANNQSAFYVAATKATWEIRSGMSAGNGGTLLFSGDTTATSTATANVEDDINYFDPEVKISTALTNVSLAAGTYWFAIAPDSAGYYGDQSYIETTRGAGGVGLLAGMDGNSFINNNLPSDGALTFAASGEDFSAGITGTVTILPEPSTLPLLAAGLFGGFFIVRRRRFNPRVSPSNFVGDYAAPSFFSPIEALESRQLMSVTAFDPAVAAAHALRVAARHERHTAAVDGAKINTFAAHHKFNALSIVHVARNPKQAIVKKQAVYTPIVGAYNPAQVRTAYGVTSLGTANQGQGITIGIVDEFDDANIISDANVFSTQYALPVFNAAGNPTLTVVKDTALGAVTSAAGTGVGGETSLDVEWAHAIAPRANILLIEVPATGSNANAFAELLHGVQLAATMGAQSISLSYGLAEASIGTSSTVVAQNNTYLATGNATKAVVTVSSGDYSTPLYPATSPNVVAVGGSSLYLASVRGQYSTETGWGGLSGAGAGGGGLSTDFSSPTYQSGNKVIFGTRAIPDVSMIADPVTGVSVYDSLDVTTAAPSPWTVIGGTSLASPVFAGVVALAQQQRAVLGKTALTSIQLNTAIYAAYNSTNYTNLFHDIKQGNNKFIQSGSTTINGFTATTGYDEATGVGSPIGSTFVPYLASV